MPGGAVAGNTPWSAWATSAVSMHGVTAKDAPSAQGKRMRGRYMMLKEVDGRETARASKCLCSCSAGAVRVRVQRAGTNAPLRC